MGQRWGVCFDVLGGGRGVNSTVVGGHRCGDCVPRRYWGAEGQAERPFLSRTCSDGAVVIMAARVGKYLLFETLGEGAFGKYVPTLLLLTVLFFVWRGVVLLRERCCAGRFYATNHRLRGVVGDALRLFARLVRSWRLLGVRAVGFPNGRLLHARVDVLTAREPDGR